LRDAARRALDLRRRVPPRPDPAALRVALEDPEVRVIEAAVAKATET
jgi:hypothetical protein